MALEHDIKNVLIPQRNARLFFLRKHICIWFGVYGVKAVSL